MTPLNLARRRLVKLQNASMPLMWARRGHGQEGDIIDIKGERVPGMVLDPEAADIGGAGRAQARQ